MPQGKARSGSPSSQTGVLPGHLNRKVAVGAHNGEHVGTLGEWGEEGTIGSNERNSPRHGHGVGKV